MVDDVTISSALAELDSIANAAMTAAEREKRAAPVLSSDLTIADVTAALARVDLEWNQRKAAAFGIPREKWVVALDVSGLGEVTDLGALLEAIHKAESAAAMLRAGYRPERDASGKVNWLR